MPSQAPEDFYFLRVLFPGAWDFCNILCSGLYRAHGGCDWNYCAALSPAGAAWASSWMGTQAPCPALCHCSTMLGLSFLFSIKCFLEGSTSYGITKTPLARTGKGLTWAGLARDADRGKDAGGCLRPGATEGRCSVPCQIPGQPAPPQWRILHAPSSAGIVLKPRSDCVDTNEILTRFPGRCVKGTAAEKPFLRALRTNKKRILVNHRRAGFVVHSTGRTVEQIKRKAPLQWLRLRRGASMSYQSDARTGILGFFQRICQCNVTSETERWQKPFSSLDTQHSAKRPIYSLNKMQLAVFMQYIPHFQHITHIGGPDELKAWSRGRPHTRRALHSYRVGGISCWGPLPMTGFCCCCLFVINKSQNMYLNSSMGIRLFLFFCFLLCQLCYADIVSGYFR